MIGVYVNFITEMMVGVLISFTTLLFTISKIEDYSFTEDPDLVAVSLNWVIILPLVINFLMFNFANLAKGMSSF
jgi:hypothetical protein